MHGRMEEFEDIKNILSFIGAIHELDRMPLIPNTSLTAVLAITFASPNKQTTPQHCLS